MNKGNFADISYSKQLKDEFKDADWWWVTLYDAIDLWDATKEEREKLKATGYEVRLKEKVKCPEQSYPALTTDMVLERLPDYIKSRGNMLTMVKADSGLWWVNYPNHAGEVTLPFPEFTDKKLPNALCKLFLWLKQEKLNG